ncbi:MAG: hypothetical protein JSU61_08630 [Fidelibacterota bacterium]|nr:MAG: hypothetical protein JSU61_08630 [Candidatus Neomarinimicrobiota bacterium]
MVYNIGIISAQIRSCAHNLRQILVILPQQILAEQDFQLAGCTSKECAVEIGQLLGVTTMVAVSIGRVGSTYSIDIRTIDVQTGAIIQSFTHDYQGRIDGLLVK